MAHELAGALQQAGRIRQRCAVKEPHVYVRSEYIDVAEGRIAQTCNRTAVMQDLPDLVPASSHHLKPVMRDGSQFAWMFFHPRIDGGIALDNAVESQQFRSHRRSIFAFGSMLRGTPTRGTKGIAPQKRRRIHEYLSFRAAVKTDAGTAAAAHTDDSKVRIARQPPGTPKSENLSARSAR